MASFVKEEDGTVTANVRTDVPTPNAESICGRIALAAAEVTADETTNTTEEI